MLGESRKLLAREKEIKELGGGRRVAAMQQLVEARKAALTATDPAAALGLLADVIRDVSLWTPPAPGQDSLLTAKARSLARNSTHRAVKVGIGESVLPAAGGVGGAGCEGDRVGAVDARDLAKRRARQGPVKVLMLSDHPEAWATLLSAPDRFVRVHDAALVRQLGSVQTGYPVPPKRATCEW